MRYIIQIIVMLVDLAILTACGFAIYYFPILGIIASIITYNTWKSQGGLIAWTHYKIFLKNAKEIGL